MNVRDIIEDYLQANGYTGLVNEEIPCGCVLGDLEPQGDCMCGDVCDAGYVHYCKDCPKEIQEECTVDGCPCAGGYCVGPEKEVKLKEPDPPPEPWANDVKLQDRILYLLQGNGLPDKMMTGTVKMILPGPEWNVVPDGEIKLAYVMRYQFRGFAPTKEVAG